jgi:hypothetical protein
LGVADIDDGDLGSLRLEVTGLCFVAHNRNDLTTVSK